MQIPATFSLSTIEAKKIEIDAVLDLLHNQSQAKRIKGKKHPGREAVSSHRIPVETQTIFHASPVTRPIIPETKALTKALKQQQSLIVQLKKEIQFFKEQKQVANTVEIRFPKKSPGSDKGENPNVPTLQLSSALPPKGHLVRTKLSRPAVVHSNVLELENVGLIKKGMFVLVGLGDSLEVHKVSSVKSKIVIFGNLRADHNFGSPVFVYANKKQTETELNRYATLNFIQSSILDPIIDKVVTFSLLRQGYIVNRKMARGKFKRTFTSTDICVHPLQNRLFSYSSMQFTVVSLVELYEKLIRFFHERLENLQIPLLCSILRSDSSLHLLLQTFRVRMGKKSIHELISSFQDSSRIDWWKMFVAVWAGNSAVSNYSLYRVSCSSTISQKQEFWIRVYDLLSAKYGRCYVTGAFLTSHLPFQFPLDSYDIKSFINVVLKEHSTAVFPVKGLGDCTQMIRGKRELNGKSIIEVHILPHLSLVLGLDTCGICHLFDQDFNLQKSQRLFYFEPVIEKQIETDSDFSLFFHSFLKEDLEAFATNAFDTLLVIFRSCCPNFRLLAVDKSNSMVVCNTTLITGAISVHELSSFSRLYRIRSPIKFTRDEMLFKNGDKSKLLSEFQKRTLLKSCVSHFEIHGNFVLVQSFEASVVYLLDLSTGDLLKELMDPLSSQITAVAFNFGYVSFGTSTGSVILHQFFNFRVEKSEKKLLAIENKLVSSTNYSHGLSEPDVIRKVSSLIMAEHKECYIWKKGIIVSSGAVSTCNVLFQGGDLREISRRLIFPSKTARLFPFGPDATVQSELEIESGMEVAVFEFSHVDLVLELGKRYSLPINLSLNRKRLLYYLSMIPSLIKFSRSELEYLVGQYFIICALENSNLFRFFKWIFAPLQSQPQTVFSACNSSVLRLKICSSVIFVVDSAQNTYVFSQPNFFMQPQLLAFYNRCDPIPFQFGTLGDLSDDSALFAHNTENFETLSRPVILYPWQGIIYQFDDLRVIIVETLSFSSEFLDFERMKSLATGGMNRTIFEVLQKSRFRIRSIYFFRSQSESDFSKLRTKTVSQLETLSNTRCVIYLLSRSKMTKYPILLRRKISRQLRSYLSGSFTCKLPEKPVLDAFPKSGFVKSSMLISMRPVTFGMGFYFRLPVLKSVYDNSQSLKSINRNHLLQKSYRELSSSSILSRFQAKRIIPLLTILKLQMQMNARGKPLPGHKSGFLFLGFSFYENFALDYHDPAYLVINSFTPLVFDYSTLVGNCPPVNAFSSLKFSTFQELSNTENLLISISLKYSKNFNQLTLLYKSNVFSASCQPFRVFDVNELIVWRDIVQISTTQWLGDTLSNRSAIVRSHQSSMKLFSGNKAALKLNGGIPIFSVLEITDIPSFFPGIYFSYFLSQASSGSHADERLLLVWRVGTDLYNNSLGPSLTEFREMLFQSDCPHILHPIRCSFTGQVETPFLVFPWNRDFISLTSYVADPTYHSEIAIDILIKKLSESVLEVIKEFGQFSCISSDNTFLNLKTKEIKFMLLPTFQNPFRQLYVRFNVSHPIRQLFLDRFNADDSDWSEWYLKVVLYLLTTNFFPAFSWQRLQNSFQVSTFFQWVLLFLLDSHSERSLKNKLCSGYKIFHKIEHIRGSFVEKLFQLFRIKLLESGYGIAEAESNALRIFLSLRNFLMKKRVFPRIEKMVGMPEMANVIERSLNCGVDLRIMVIFLETFLSIDSNYLHRMSSISFVKELNLFANILEQMRISSFRLSDSKSNESVQLFQPPVDARNLKNLVTSTNEGVTILNFLEKSKRSEESRKRFDYIMEEFLQFSGKYLKRILGLVSSLPQVSNFDFGERKTFSFLFISILSLCRYSHDGCESLNSKFLEEIWILLDVLEKSSLTHQNLIEEGQLAEFRLQNFTVNLAYSIFNLVFAISFGNEEFVTFDDYKQPTMVRSSLNPLNRFALVGLRRILSKQVAPKLFKRVSLLQEYKRRCNGEVVSGITHLELSGKFISELDSFAVPQNNLMKRRVSFLSSINSSIKNLKIPSVSSLAFNFPAENQPIILDWILSASQCLLAFKLHNFFAFGTNVDIMNQLLSLCCNIFRHCLSHNIEEMDRFWKFSLTVTSLSWLGGLFRSLKISLQRSVHSISDKLFELFFLFSYRKIWIRHWKHLNLKQFFVRLSKKISVTSLNLVVQSLNFGKPLLSMNNDEMNGFGKQILFDYLDLRKIGTSEECTNGRYQLSCFLELYRVKLNVEVAFIRSETEMTFLSEIYSQIMLLVCQEVMSFECTDGKQHNSIIKLRNSALDHLNLLQNIVAVIKLRPAYYLDFINAISENHSSSYLPSTGSNIFEYFAEKKPNDDSNFSEEYSGSYILIVTKTIHLFCDVIDFNPLKLVKQFPFLAKTFFLNVKFLMSSLQNFFRKKISSTIPESYPLFIRGIHRSWSIISTLAEQTSLEKDFIDSELLVGLDSWMFSDQEKLLNSREPEKVVPIFFDATRISLNILEAEIRDNFIYHLFVEQHMAKGEKLNYLFSLIKLRSPGCYLNYVISRFLTGLVSSGFDFYVQVSFF
jgi:hypothetical protein